MKPRLLLLISIIVIGITWYCWWPSEATQPTPASPPKVAQGASQAAPAAAPTSMGSTPSAPKSSKTTPQIPLTPEQQTIEANKVIDRDHLKKLHAGVLAYRSKYGHYPEYLSQLAPEFVSADTLVSPQGSNFTAKTDHPDPGVATPHYGYEFSNLEFRDGRTFAEIKEIQRSEWGDVVPMLRYFGYDKVINCSCRGDMYETALNWEWDPATLNMVDQYGWGPGLKTGQMVEVKVVGKNGEPIPNAKVYADGRNYSFDLPDRPYTTDAQGNVKIPIGADTDRTALQLRLSAPGLATPTLSFPRGEVPASQTITASPAQQVGGQILDADGYPAANLRIALRTPIGDSASEQFATVSQVMTDEEGNWSAAVAPTDAERFVISTTVAGPHFGGYSTNGNLPVDHASATQGRATNTLPQSSRMSR